MNETDQFGAAQLGFNLGDAAPTSFEPDRDEVRAELQEILAIAQGATDEAPWDAGTLQYHKVVFPQMACWLPSDERDQLVFAFAREVERIELLMAA